MAREIGIGVEALRQFAEMCIRNGGVPQFKTKYGGQRLPENAVIVSCWGAGDKVKGGKVKHVPPEVIARLERGTGDWRWLLGR